MVIHEVFELSLAHPDVDDATEAFTLADHWFQRNSNLSLVGIEAGVKAAQRCGMLDKAREYEEIAANERKRIDDMMKGLGRDPEPR
jgi:hypothetical protein